MKGDIVFGSDIVANVAKQLGVSEKKVKHVFDFLFLHIRKSARQPEVFSLKLPRVGRLYLLTELTKKVLYERDKKDTVSSKYRKTHTEALKKVEVFEERFKKECAGDYVRTVHKKGANLRNYFFTKGKTLRELELIQNSDE